MPTYMEAIEKLVEERRKAKRVSFLKAIRASATLKPRSHRGRPKSYKAIKAKIIANGKAFT